MFSNICEALNHWAETTPDALAVFEGGRRYSYRDFRRHIHSARRSLDAEPITRTGTAVVIMPGLLDNWIANIALRSLGLTTIALRSADQIAQMGIRDTACIVTTRRELDKIAADEAAKGFPLVALPGGGIADVPDSALPATDFGGHVLYTSGTTGVHKRVLLDARGERDRNRLRASHFDITQATLHHAWNFGLWTGIGFKHSSAVWHMGGGVVFNQRPDAADNFFELPITTSCLIHADLRHILARHAGKPRPAKPWHLVWGGGFMPHDLAERVIRDLNAHVTVGYGATELAGVTLYSTYDGLDDLIWYKCHEDREVEIVDADGQPCATGVEGELRVRMKDVDSPCYLDDAETSARFFRGGYFHPGDMAVRRDDGRVRILGRVGDVINLQGQKVPLAPLEEELQRVLAVEEVCIFTAMKDDGKEEMVIALQAAARPDVETLKAVAIRFRSFNSVRFSTLEAFPRASTGMKKTRRSELRQMVLAGIG